MILFNNGIPELSGKDIHRSFRVRQGQRLDLALVALESGDASIDIDVDGQDADIQVKGVYVCADDDRVNIKVNLSHNVGGSVSNQLFKGIVSGRAKVNFDGIIIVRPDAGKTEAYQTSCNLQMSDDAVVQSSPQLEIYADDVKCSHGATVGSLDEDEQFYMRSRGISVEEARRLQMLSFLAPVTSGLDEQTKQEIYSRL